MIGIASDSAIGISIVEIDIFRESHTNNRSGRVFGIKRWLVGISWYRNLVDNATGHASTGWFQNIERVGILTYHPNQSIVFV